MLAGTAVGVLVGVAIMFLIAGRIAEDRLDDRVDNVTKEFDASLDRFQDEVRKELDARAAQGGIAPVTPTPTVAPLETPTVDADAGGRRGRDPDAHRVTRRFAAGSATDAGRRDPAPLASGVDLLLVVLQHAPGAELRPERAQRAADPGDPVARDAIA